MTQIKLGKINDVLDIGPAQLDNVHGRWSKSLIVMHETVSPDYVGWKDIISISNYLDVKDYGIHGIVDKEGHIAWAHGLGTAIFWHAASSPTGMVNTRSIGIELISRVMLDAKDNTSRWKIWWERDKEINAAAQLLAWISRVHSIPLQYVTPNGRGITSHWHVSKYYGVADPHTDCHPRHLGGYFPMLRLIERAKFYRSLGY